MSFIIKTHSREADLAAELVEMISVEISGFDDARRFSIMLPGGSTPRKIFDILVARHKESLPWKRIQFFWGDERCVGPENPESNYKMARSHLLDPLLIPQENIFRIMGENDARAESDRYQTLVRKHVKEPTAEHGEKTALIPRFDLVLLGMGEDGHTASLFPGGRELFDDGRLFVPARNPYTGQDRISATITLINHARRVVFLVTGEQKANRISQVIHKKEGWEHLPVSKVVPGDGILVWLLDTEAAKKL